MSIKFSYNLYFSAKNNEKGDKNCHDFTFIAIVDWVKVKWEKRMVESLQELRKPMKFICLLCVGESGEITWVI